VSKTVTLVWLMAVTGLIIGTFLSLLSDTSDLRDQTASLRAQVQAQARQHAADQAALAAERAGFAQATARIGGAHRDLITCADIAELQRGLSVTGTDSMGGSVFSVLPGQPWLPAHCINQ
jgi:Tfp pilus assembly protein PilO